MSIKSQEKRAKEEKRNKREPQNYSELKKTWCKPLNGKGIVSRLHKELLKLNS